MRQSLVWAWLLVCVCSGGGGCHGFSLRFWELGEEEVDQMQAAEQEIDPACIAKAEAGDCSFYTCFHARHACEGDNWAMNYGWRYCSRFNKEYHRFSPAAQQWINATRTCTMRHLLSYYSEASVTCQRLEEDVRAAHARCERNNGVCNTDMLMDNKHVLIDVYQFSHQGLLRFLMFMQECGKAEIGRFTSWLSWYRTEKPAYNPDCIYV